jgi:hypothetical protein
MRTFHRVVAGVVVLTLAGFAALSLGGTHLDSVVPASVRASGAGDYCTTNGGALIDRYPVYGTNGPGSLRLAGSHKFCEFTASDGSQIDIFADTLYDTEPSLAALAYYAQVQPGSCTGNPASCYCSLLGGSDLFGGINAAGGGWVEQGHVNNVMEACIFPDLSSIDSWGLFYYSAGIIRGMDLSTVMRYPNPYAKKQARK